MPEIEKESLSEEEQKDKNVYDKKQEERHGWIVEINNYSEMFFTRQSLFDTIRSVWTHERKNPLGLPVVLSSKEIEEILGG